MEKGSFFDKQQECFSDATEEERQSLIHWVLEKGGSNVKSLLLEKYFLDLTKEECPSFVYQVLEAGKDSTKRFLLDEYFSDIIAC
jgi:hypothetical protein